MRVSRIERITSHGGCCCFDDAHQKKDNMDLMFIYFIIDNRLALVEERLQVEDIKAKSMQQVGSSWY